ncbi:hypothetical protein FRB90_011542 [Tulasnella sp. 427]|nr:hypothetical protein FRB90_011542 [Tulasnella sp. 427]
MSPRFFLPAIFPTKPSQVLDSILATIHHPFRELDQVLHPTAPASTASVNLSIDLLTSTAAPLYTAAIVVLSPHSTPIETTLLRSLSHHIPVIPFSPHQQRRRRHHSPDYYNDSRAQSRHRPSSRLSHSQYSRAGSRAPSVPRLAPISDSPNAFDQVPNFTFHPTSHRALKEWLFDESTVKTLRKEAAEKFLTWRERERKVEAYLTRPPRPTTDDSTPPHNSLMHQHQEQHQQPPVIPLDAFERFTFDQIFTPSDFESADLDSEVDRAVAGFATTDDEGEVADVESRGQSDAEDVGLARGQYLGREAWEADLSRMVALRKRERDQQHHRQQSSYTLSTIRPSSFHTQFQTDRSLRRPLSEVVPSHVEADNLLLFHPNPSAGTRRGAVAALESDATPDYDSLEHGEAGYQTASSDVGSCFSSAFPPTSTTADLNARPPNQDTAASDPPAPAIVDFASVDPLHFPSLLSLALSILPEIKTRIVARIKFWFLPAAFTLPRHSDDLGDVVNEKKHPHHQVGKRGEPLWDEKRGVDSESECGSEVENEQYSNEIMLSLPAVGAIAAAAAALGFWAGVSMEGRAGLLTLRSM